MTLQIRMYCHSKIGLVMDLWQNRVQHVLESKQRLNFCRIHVVYTAAFQGLQATDYFCLFDSSLEPFTVRLPSPCRLAS
jgi:hypothetical protein